MLHADFRNAYCQAGWTERLEAPSTLAEQPGQNHNHGDHDGGGPKQSGTEQVAKHAEQHARHSQHPSLARAGTLPTTTSNPSKEAVKPTALSARSRARGGRCRPICRLLGRCSPTIRTSSPSPNNYKSFCAPK
jgi:hypothetical protein